METFFFSSSETMVSCWCGRFGNDAQYVKNGGHGVLKKFLDLVGQSCWFHRK
jgi:hypothetical protein